MRTPSAPVETARDRSVSPHGSVRRIPSNGPGPPGATLPQPAKVSANQVLVACVPLRPITTTYGDAQWHPDLAILPRPWPRADTVGGTHMLRMRNASALPTACVRF